MEKVLKKFIDEREQVISVIAEHVNNERFTKRDLAEMVLDLALTQSTNSDEFLDSVKELCEENECTLYVWHAQQFGYFDEAFTPLGHFDDYRD